MSPTTAHPSFSVNMQPLTPTVIILLIALAVKELVTKVPKFKQGYTYNRKFDR